MRARKRWILLAYLALLAVSHIYRAMQPPGTAGPGRSVETLALFDASGRQVDGSVEVAYREWGREHRDERPAVIVLHGSPGSSREFSDLGPAIAVDRWVVAPDLPGFGASGRDVPSYSIRAHAEYVRRLTERLELEHFDLVGFSMGGGVALHLSELEPGRVRSLSLLSSIGVQELELLGSYELNHSIHGLQLGGLWLLYEAVPHFGLLDGSMLSVEYARNFYDTDQRPLRDVLRHLTIPTLILHGRDDPLVPVEAAVEHHRIVPHSRMVLFEGDHFALFTRPDTLIEPLAAFLDLVDRGQAQTPETADEERLAAAREPFDPRAKQPASGFSLFVIMVLLAAATLISEDLACIGAGLLAAQGSIGLPEAILACFIGIVVGDVGLYWAGRLLGRRAITLPPFRWVLSEARLAESAAWFERRGALVILLTRFIPGTRLPTYFSAGLLKTGFFRFTFFFLIASAIWTPLLVGLASLVGVRLFEYFEVFQRNALLGLVAAAVVVWSVMKLIPVLLTWRGRRLALGWWRRTTHWEFWPWWVIYLPVFGWVLWLGLRFRGPTLFTLANPGIDCGGFAGESKGDLLAQMPAASLPRWERLGADLDAPQRLARLDAFLGKGVELPIVLKPDSGERGFRVVIARDRSQAQSYLTGESTEDPSAVLLQDYVPGAEFGVFYVRRPGEERGRVTSVAAKILPEAVGDGESTLEHLILADDRTVCQAPWFLARMEAALETVPVAGERVSLGDLGTHSRGALFLDANHLITPELEAAIDAIGRAVEGFHLGRFDVRAPSAEHLSRGEDLRVLELNGVTSEEAHMYDPRHGVLYAWRTLARQWRTAFEIGAANRGLGLEPDGVRDLWRTYRDYSRSKAQR